MTEPADALRLKVELQSLGVRLALESGLAPRAGGAGPAEGITVTIDDLVATVPTGAPYVRRSPYSLGDGGLLMRRGEALRKIELLSEPRFYQGRTSGGVPMRKVALRHGTDGIGSTVAQSCVRAADACSFCGIAITRGTCETLAVKEPEDIAEVAASASAEGFRHFVLTTGTTDLETCGIPHLAACARAVKKATSGSMQVHLQFEPPEDESLIREVAAHADSAAINMECFDAETLRRVAPGKAAAGIEKYERAWRAAVDAFGAGQVTCFIVAGLGDPQGSVVRGCELLASLGVFPFVLPLRPIPGTPMETRTPPAPDEMLSLYQVAASVIRKSGLSSSMCSAGCVRCGACSAITDMV